MSERVGSDIERLWILIDNSYLYRLKPIEYVVIEIQSCSMSGPTLSDIYPKNEMALVWTTLKYHILRTYEQLRFAIYNGYGRSNIHRWSRER